MITEHRLLIAGNWKMNGRKLSLKELGLMIEGYAGLRDRVDLLLCPPFTLLHAAAVIALGSGIAIGAQDCHTEPSGAHTGDISAGMIADCGATHVILGHSERRAGHSESDALVKSKTAAAHAAGLHAVVCIGETLTQRDAGKAVDVTRRQLSRSLPDSATAANTTIAYEPVWAIGTGLVPVNENIIEIHAAIREGLSRGFGKKPGAAFRILYGGSVKPGNAKEILGLANVNGALAGGASLKAADFLAIAASV